MLRACWTPIVVFALIAGCAAPDPAATESPSPSPGEQVTGNRPPSRTHPPTRTQHEPQRRESGPAPDPFADGFVAAHNSVRARAPSASPAVPGLRWSPELARTAQAWAERCVFEHSGSDHGENLSARTDRAEPATIVEAWASEAANFDHRRNRCASGEVCGHYTQVVWRNTTAVGCGVAQCSGGGPFGSGTWFFWVCNYDPPGNWKGERPY